MSSYLRAVLSIWMVTVLALPAVCALPSAGEIDALRAQLEQRENIKERYKLGVLHAMAGNYDDAIESWHRILANKQSGLALVAKVKLARSIAVAHYRAKRFDKASLWIETAFRKAPTDPRVIKARDVINRALEDQKNQPPTPSSEPPPPPPKLVEKAPTAEEIKAAFMKGEADYKEAAALVEAAADLPAVEKALSSAIPQLEIAIKGDYRKAKALFYLGSAHFLRNDDDRKDLDPARDHLEASLALDADKATLINLGMTYGLLLQTDKQIENLEKALELDASSAETHFRLAMAYDKSGRPDAARKTFEHAKAAIRLNTEYKKKFQGVLKNSEVATQIAGIVEEIIKASEEETLTDEKTEAYAKKFQEMLGSDTVKIDELKDRLKKGGVKGLMNSEEGKKLLKSEEAKRFLESERGKAIQDRALKK